MIKGILILAVLFAAVGGGFRYIQSQSSKDANIAAEAQRQAAVMMASLYGASQTLGTPQANTSTSPPPPAAAPSTSPAAAEPPARITQATLPTNKGDITIEFLAAQAPKTVANFIKLAQDGFYNGTKFHRVIAGFMIQGGDPFSKDDTAQARWGTGGPGYMFADEITPGNHNAAGTIAMANAGPNTNGSQFFINVAENSSLDTKHTVFGRVTAGVDVVKSIEAVATTDPGDRPLLPIAIESVSVR